MSEDKKMEKLSEEMQSVLCRLTIIESTLFRLTEHMVVDDDGEDELERTPDMPPDAREIQ